MIESFLSVLNADLLIAALIAVFSGVIHGYTGFGAALFMTPLFALLFGPVDAIALSVIIAIFGSAQLYPRAARNARWRELIPAGLATVVFAPLGTYLLFSLDAEVIRRSMGGFVLLAALILLSGWVYKGPRGNIASAVAGGLAGIISGATGVGGPPLAIYFLSAPVPPAVQRANIVIAIAATIAVVLISLFVAGGITGGTFLRSVVLIPPYVIGTWFGSYLFTIAPQQYFRSVALWLLMATGIGIVFL
jgi:uncharacterized membrane protein YfcA